MNVEQNIRGRIDGQTRKRKKQRKENVRKRLLAKIPKNGVCVEIGVWRGEFSKTLLRTLEPAHLILVDPWEVDAQGDADEALSSRTGVNEMEKIYRSILKNFQSQINSGQVAVLRERSDSAILKMDDGSIDFAYVDGDHSYEGVRADLLNLYPKLRPAGVIALDDYHRKGWWGNSVIRAVNEFVGENADSIRVLALEGAQIAIQKLP